VDRKAAFITPDFGVPAWGGTMKISAAFSAHDNKAGCAEVDG